jgi:hypothetical protein
MPMRLGDNLAKPAGNRYDSAGNPSGVRGCEKRYDQCNVVRLADTSQGGMFGDTRADAFRGAGYHRNLIY